MVQIWQRYKSLQMISPLNTDHEIFIWRGTPVLFFSKNFSRYQNFEILWCLNVIALSTSYVYIRPLQVQHGLESFFKRLLLYYIVDYCVY